MKYRSSIFAATVAVAVLALVATPRVGGSPALAATPPPTPPPLTTSTTAPAVATTAPIVAPSAAPSAAVPAGIPTLSPAVPKGHATPAPPSDIRKGIEGVWEVQIQRDAKTEYVHFKLKQTDNAITGIYMDHDSKTFPLAGSLDGKTLQIVVTFPDGTTTIFKAELDGTTDMLGLMTSPKEQVPFTAAYRPKESFFDNINPGTGMGGGIGQPGSAMPGGPG